MKRAACVGLIAFIVASSCADDRVEIVRGPLGPASYEVEVDAEQGPDVPRERHRATLRIDPSDDGASFALHTQGGSLVTAEMRFARDGSVDLVRVRGAPVASGQTELASLVGQLNPPLPDEPVRLGDRWSSTQRISTRTLEASLNTELRLARFRRIASTDAAELIGDVTGRLRVTEGSRTLEGRLGGRTQIAWGVRAGRVVDADTELVWELSDGSRVVLETKVSPR